MRNLLLAGAAIAALAATPAAAQNNTSNVSQTGSGALTTVLQDGANDRSNVSQSGGGTVSVHQTGNRGSTSNVTTSADDRPPESTVTVRQRDNGGSTAAIGESNVSAVIQDNVNGFGASGTGSTVNVDQNHNAGGTGQNSSYVQQGRNAVSGQVAVTQSGGENVSYYSSTTSTDNDAVVNQSGVRNRSAVFQNFQNGSAMAMVTQVNGAGGAENSAYIEQASAGFATNPAQFAVGADAMITQSGSGNASSIVQTGYSQTESTSNFAANGQFGQDNSSSIVQSGTDGTALVTQYGHDNQSSVNQGGTGNMATVSQGSYNNISNVAQSGSGNTATVMQGGSGM